MIILSELIHKIGIEIDSKKLQDLNDKLWASKQDVKQLYDGFALLGQQVSHVGRMMTMYITAPILGLGTVSVMASMEIERLKVAIQDIAPAGADLVGFYKDLDKMQPKTLFSPKQIYEYANSLIQLGTPLKDITSIITKFGNINATNPTGNTNITGMIAAYQQLKLKGRADQGLVSAFGPVVEKRLREQLGYGKNQLGYMKYMQAMSAVGGISEATMMRAVDSVAGDRTNAMAHQMNTLSGALTTLWNTITNMRMAIGQTLEKKLHLARVVKNLVDVLKQLTAIWKVIPGWMQTGVIAMAAFLVVLGPLLAMFGTLLMMLPGLKAGFAMLKIAMVAAGVETTIAWGPMIATILAVVAALAVLYLLWDEITVWMKGGDSYLKDWFGSWENAKTTVLPVLDAILKVSDLIGTSVKGWAMILDLAGKAVEWVGDKFGKWESKSSSTPGGFLKDWFGPWENFIKLIDNAIASFKVLWDIMKFVFTHDPLQTAMAAAEWTRRQVSTPEFSGMMKGAINSFVPPMSPPPGQGAMAGSPVVNMTFNGPTNSLEMKQAWHETWNELANGAKTATQERK
jgi:hypothetical protein